MGDLGITGWNLAVQMVAFILFIYVFWRWALGPIVGMLENRQNTIRESLEEAERMRREMAEAEERNEQILAEARRDAQEVLANAREQAEQNVARSREQAQEQADEMIAKAQEVISAETEQARQQLRQEIADLAVDAASKIVRANLDRDAQSRLIEQAIAEADRENTSLN